MGSTALIVVDFAKEEIYLPILEDQPDNQVRALFERMTRAAMATTHTRP
jgi:hypothetical protein